jgi:hypothetical protein
LVAALQDAEWLFSKHLAQSSNSYEGQPIHDTSSWASASAASVPVATSVTAEITSESQKNNIRHGRMSICSRLTRPQYHAHDGSKRLGGANSCR